jgi:hypothetical protein
MASTGTSLTKGLEQNKTLPFLDVLVKKKMDGTLGHTVYRKNHKHQTYFYMQT